MSTSNLAVHLVARAGWTLLAQNTLQGSKPTSQYLNHARNPHAFEVDSDDLMALLREVDVFTLEGLSAEHRIVGAMVACAEALAKQSGCDRARKWLTHELDKYSEDYIRWLGWVERVKD